MRTIRAGSAGTIWQVGPFSFLVRTRDNTAGIELVLGRLAIYYGFMSGRPVFEWEVFRD